MFWVTALLLIAAAAVAICLPDLVLMVMYYKARKRVRREVKRRGKNPYLPESYYDEFL